jgi:predicted acylesterase/phospholipase RssA
MDVSIAYQGGGAKLFDLLAAVKAAQSFEAENQGRFRVIRVSGASAGAIAAILHALNADIDELISKSTELDEVIRGTFQNNRPKIFSILKSAIFNRPLFEERQIRSAIGDLLRSAGINGELTIENLMHEKLVQLRILSSDILGYQRPCHDEKSPTQLVEALLDSCAIPFAFRLPSNAGGRASIVDGGLFQNLPAEEALRDLKVGQRALGISFESKTRDSVEGAGVLRYAGTILDSMISERVAQSAQQLGSANVLRLRTDLGTFDFGRIFQKPVKERFDAQVRAVRVQLEAWYKGASARTTPDWFSLEKHDLLELEHITSTKALAFYENVHVKDFHAEEAVHEVFAQSLLGDEYPDIYTTTLRLSGSANPGLQFLRMRFYAPDGQQLLQPEVSVDDSDGNPFPALILPMREPGGRRARSVLICLATPLADGQTVVVRKIENAHGAMRQYVEAGWTEETLGIGPGKSAKTMSIVAHFPNTHVPKARHDANEDVEIERNLLSEEDGKQVPTESSRRRDQTRGTVSYINTANLAAEPLDRRRFIKVFYYR